MQLLSRLLEGPLRELEPLEQEIFRVRFEGGYADTMRPLQVLYGHLPAFERYRDRFFEIAARNYAARPPELRLLDLKRSIRPDWFQRSVMLGYVCYADRFADDLRGVAGKIPYLRELGVTYLHLMPLLRSRPGPNDGGYAVMDYRQLSPHLGSMADLAWLASELRRNEISLCIDVVCNHTAKEHEWARRALADDPVYQDYFLMYDDRRLPEQYEQTLPEVFPEFKAGNFTYYEQIDRWVWTTFHEYQWDLNYTNPAVFAEMLDIILYLANQGAEILRLDAVAFMWKRLGTDSQNQPEAHYLLQAWRALSRLAAPGLLLKAEAIVPPDKLIPYLGRGLAADKECELAYHNVFMVLLWSSLAERKAVLMTHALQQMPPIPSGSAWLTYVRLHDDIGWAVTDEDAAGVGLSGFLHRAFLSDFYSGRYPGTFARGTTFQFNPRTGDRRINGSLASLAGLEMALELGDEVEIDLAIRRIWLLHSLIFAFGGLPIIYMGDEIGLLNDYGFLDDPDLADDSRWVHRPRMDWQLAEDRHDPASVHGRIFAGLRRLIAARKRTPALHARAGTRSVWTHNDRVFGLVRESARGRLLILANFSERPQSVAATRLHALGFQGSMVDHIDGRFVEGWFDVRLGPYETLWLGHLEAT